LLVIPGSEFPKQKIFPHFDKVVHVVIFFVLCYLFCRPFKNTTLTISEKKSWFISIALYAFAYGIIMEFVQKYFVPFRGYDEWDMAADGLGSLCAFLWSKKYFLTEVTAKK